MEGVAILRRLIGQLQGICDSCGFSPPRPIMEHSDRERWTVLGLHYRDSGSVCELIKSPSPAKKPRKHCEKSTSPPMEQSIWQELPDDLLENVIARLPVAALFRLRAVCRQWNSLLRSLNFSDSYSTLPPPSPWLYTTHSDTVDGVAVYDTSSRQWRHPPAPISFTDFAPVASAGGLICFGNTSDIFLNRLFITNPLTCSSRELPPRWGSPWLNVHTVMIYDSIGYMILSLGFARELQIYDSSSGNWSYPIAVSNDVTFPLRIRSHAVVIGQTVYYLRRAPEGIVSYDVLSGRWRQLHVPLPPYVRVAVLGECDRRLLLVGLTRKNAAACVCVWELQKMCLLWKEVDRMPNEWCLDMYGKTVSMKSYGSRRLFVLALRSGQVTQLVNYDALTREWHRISDWEWRSSDSFGVSFQPSPFASP